MNCLNFMLFVLLPSLQFTDDISSKHTHLFQIRGKDTTFLSQISGNSVKVCYKSVATPLKFVVNQRQRQKHTIHESKIQAIYTHPVSAILTDLLQPDKPSHSRSFGNQDY